MARQIRTVGVVGLGTMGSGIAEVLARHGFGVIGVEVDAAAADRARTRIEASTERAVERGKLQPADRAELLARIEFSTEPARVADAGLVIEAVPEVLGLKREILASLDAVVAPDAILATNTSSLPVTEIAVATSNPRRVIGLHFFNPAPVQELVEVVRTVVSDEDVVDDAALLVRALGKEPVVVGDQAGFIANALLFGYLNHAVSMFEAKYARREDIDDAMRLGCGLPMGPLALMDLIGLDTAYEILDSMYHQTRDRLHAPAPLIKQMVTAGLTGRKSGRGFYRYAAPGSSVVIQDARLPAGGPVADRGRDVQSVGVVGSGTMATGIVEVLAKAGLDVLFVARTPEKAEAVRAGLRQSLDRSVTKGRITPDQRDAALGKVRGTTALADLGDADLVLEAVVEDLEVKQALFRDLDRICRPGAVLATTTSSLPVIECAAVTGRPQDVIGIHFFNPAPAMRLVEVVSTVSTAEDVTLTAVKLCRHIRKHPVTCGDRAGFIVNALLFPYLNDAVKMLCAHYAQAQDIDRAMRLGCGYPMGPFELLDVVGLDVSLAIEKVLFHEFREPGFAPSPMLEHLVTAGYLGRKTGRGFRTYG
ncbi:3-hydroxybutyryl-CoA dehydrogenase [Kineosporia sp. NBRC 101731]|uniref:3-hydroxyacyl-CoA dehydrogenase family protein n=1 Tax=Kineosporia sp. NBRC 101731 TaxID=3032199 RepID=UPI0024A3A269|nr:3-hydroxybutyryl-CoA dehydrogenase [Kineosporia sp. NBRC 101731]GLY28038.1 3-hydroxybutyryl-CoA dehydrogenase [Kineosporia sp. NBRC 101731]